MRFQISSSRLRVRILLVLSSWLFLSVAAVGAPVAKVPTSSGFLKSDLPLAFEPNQGQFDPRIRYLCSMPGFSLYLTNDGAILSLDTNGTRAHAKASESGTVSSTASLRLVGASRQFEPEALDRLPGSTNYLIGNDRSRWLTGIAQYRRVQYRQVYPGIDVIYYGDGRKLEYDFKLRPGADPEKIRLAFEGLDDLHFNATGDLLLVLAGREILQRKPVAYQDINGTRVPVSAKYRIDPRTKQISIALGKYDRGRKLIIDPVLQYGTFFGGSGVEGANYLAVDSAGNAYITGKTTSPNLPTSPGSVFQPTLRGAANAFVAKLNPAGTALVYRTYIGGSGEDEGTAIAVDSAGIAYLCGLTSSANFPVRGLVSGVTTITGSQYSGGAHDGFVSILNSTGTDLVFSSYIGGPGDDVANALTIDSNNVYVAGYSSSTTLTGLSSNAAQRANAGSYDAFAVKLTKQGSPVWSTFFGGVGEEVANGIAVDSTGKVFVAGSTTSPQLPQAASSRRGSGRDVFLAVISAVGTSFLGAVDLGGSGDQSALGLVVDTSGLAYLTGFTTSPDFPITSPTIQTQNHGGTDAFVTVVNAQFLAGKAATVLFSTYLGGRGSDEGYAIALGSRGDIYVGGYTNSPDFAPSLPVLPSAGSNTFVVELGA
ncbi:MAG: SBBP repeat-containing protein, partial [Acidobacteriota bacterium]|nr:SBBP repeat-containing protein [Acidobacteriota bacterium]